MYGATWDGLIELLFFYGGLFVSAIFAIVALCLIPFNKKEVKKISAGSAICGAASGVAFVLLVSSGIVSKGHGAELGWLILIPFFLSATAYFISFRRRQ